MKRVYRLIGAALFLTSCQWGPSPANPMSRPFEVDITPLRLHVGDTVTVTYRYLGTGTRYRILFGQEQASPDTMLELGEPTSDPGSFSFVLEPKMVDRHDPGRFVEVSPGRHYRVGFVGYDQGEAFGAVMGDLPVLPATIP